MLRQFLFSTLVFIAAPAAAAPAALVRSVAQAAADAAASSGAAKYFEGVTLVDQNGRKVDLYRDLIAGHTIVMHSFFANCTASCPIVMSTLQSLQERFGERMESEVRLLSITVDPVHDSPALLKDYAARLHARPGWMFLSGSTEQVALALRRIGQYTDDPSSHMDLLVAGNDRTGLWKKILATADAAQITKSILGVADDSGTNP